MKKVLLFVVLVSFILSSLGTALAFPIDVNGDVRFQFRSWQDGVANPSPNQFNNELARIRLNFSGQIDENTSLFARLGGRSWFGDAEKTKSSSSAEGMLDHYGVKTKSGNWTFSLGRQDVNLGQGAIISTGTDVATDSKFDGMVAAGKIGTSDAQFIIGKTTMSGGGAEENWIGFDITNKLDDKVSVGAAYATDKIIAGTYNGTYYPAAKAERYWALNGTVNFSEKFSLNGEYVKSNAVNNNAAYFLAGTYNWDKDNFSIQYNSVQINSVEPFNSGIGAVAYPLNGANLPYNYTANASLTGNKYTGFTYSYTHPLTKAATFNITYFDLKSDTVSGHDKEYAAGVSYKF